MEKLLTNRQTDNSGYHITSLAEITISWVENRRHLAAPGLRPHTSSHRPCLCCHRASCVCDLETGLADQLGVTMMLLAYVCTGERLTVPVAGSTTTTHPYPADISCHGLVNSARRPTSARSRAAPSTRRRGRQTVITAVSWA